MSLTASTPPMVSEHSSRSSVTTVSGPSSTGVCPVMASRTTDTLSAADPSRPVPPARPEPVRKSSISCMPSTVG